MLADGFFEWQRSGKAKLPFLYEVDGGKPFALAGLWEGWQDPETGEWLRTCSIVTTEANAQMQVLHDRMPVILHPDDYGAWLGEQSAPPTELKALLRPWDGQLVIWPVSARMNSPGKAPDGPELIERVDAPADDEPRGLRNPLGRRDSA